MPSKKPMVLMCNCPGTEVPFYCPVHGRVENPNWPLLKAPAVALAASGDAKKSARY